MESSEKIQQSGILQVLASLLNSPSSCAAKIAHIIAEIAKNELIRIPCVDAGLIPPLVKLLNSKDQEVLLQTGRALGNICYDSHSLQAQLINMGVIPTLVKLLGVHSQNAALTEMCLVAFGNLAELESSKEQFASTNVADELVKLFKKQTEHEKKEMIFEVLAPLAEHDAIKLQLVEAGLVECLLEIVHQNVTSEKDDDIAELKTASDLMVLLLLGGSLYHRMSSDASRHALHKTSEQQLQLNVVVLRECNSHWRCFLGKCCIVGSTAVQRLHTLHEGQMETGPLKVQRPPLEALPRFSLDHPTISSTKYPAEPLHQNPVTFTRSEKTPANFQTMNSLKTNLLMQLPTELTEELHGGEGSWQELQEANATGPPGIQQQAAYTRLILEYIRSFKYSWDVIRTIIESGGIKHLVTMATSEHVIMQNEALVALGLITALELQTAEHDLESAKLIQVLHKLLSDEKSAPEIKYNSMVLICAVMGSEPLNNEVQNLAFLDVVAKLRSHENKTVAQQASLTEQRLTVQS
ncbi:rap1 GTPase-GDP dissociation stimulator 1 isoform X4 [Pelobates cultripes]|uniref:Rap1 GTPase-GDP dissociation stimulator 1 isoform X4 n=1 Tax=Pelobates cultripes TaxID=61616 RepID=A0AAD1WEQ1_PELCU|nr:rap1 GTPase-GDP dissociation stimulator 1 isoform X4 [Pelobates cultripes]